MNQMSETGYEQSFAFEPSETIAFSVDHSEVLLESLSMQALL